MVIGNHAGASDRVTPSVKPVVTVRMNRHKRGQLTTELHGLVLDGGGLQTGSRSGAVEGVGAWVRAGARDCEGKKENYRRLVWFLEKKVGLG